MVRLECLIYLQIQVLYSLLYGHHSSKQFFSSNCCSCSWASYSWSVNNFSLSCSCFISRSISAQFHNCVSSCVHKIMFLRYKRELFFGMCAPPWLWTLLQCKPNVVSWWYCMKGSFDKGISLKYCLSAVFRTGALLEKGDGREKTTMRFSPSRCISHTKKDNLVFS